MSEAYGTVLDAASVRFERLLPGPIGRVWDYLTQSELRGKWLAPGTMEPKLGGKVELTFNHADLSPEPSEAPEKYRGGHTLGGRITRFDPPHALGFTWGESGSEVTFELSERGSQVLLVVTHIKLPSRDMMRNVAGGWHAHLAILADRLAGVAPKAFWPRHAKYAAEYQARI